MDKIDYKGFTIDIVPDEYPDDPREWDNLGTMVCFHKRYDLGDKTDYNSDDFNSWDDLYDRLVKDGAVIILPLVMLDHSGLFIKVGTSFAEDFGGWDSGQIGFIYTTRLQICRAFGGERISRQKRDRAEKILRSEVETYASYVSGDVWGYGIEGIQDTVYGWYGEIDGMIAEAKADIDRHIKYERAKHANKLKSQIRNKVNLNYREVIPC